MTTKPYLDRWSWAQAILNADLWFGYRNIRGLGMRDMRQRHATESRLAFMLRYDEAYISHLIELIATDYAEEEDYRDDWEDFVRSQIHGEGCCPHEDEDAQHAYQTAYEKKVNDSFQRRSWAYQRVDVDQVIEDLRDSLGDAEGIAFFLEQHPVSEVWQAHTSQWVDIEDVWGYCPGCDEPQTVEAFTIVPPVNCAPHPHQVDCRVCDAGEGLALCAYDTQGNVRPRFQCPGCLHTGEYTDDLDDALTETFTERHGRPFAWPPGAPYPPRRGFAGEPLEIPPWERET